MPELSTALNIWRAVGDAVGCHIDGVATDSSTTTITAAGQPFQTNRANASDKRIPGTALGEGDEIYWAGDQQSSTLTAALTAAGSSFTVASGAGFSTSTARPYLVGIDQELILVTFATPTFTVLARGWGETRAAAHVSGATVYGPKFTPNPNSIATYESSTGVLTFGVPVNIDPGTTGHFDVFGRGVSFEDVRKAVNRALRDFFYEDYVPFSLVTDGDMRSPGTADWTATGSPTVSKVTNANAVEGPRSLRVLATAVNDYVQSTSIVVNPDYAPTWYVRALVRADVGTATLRAWDVTNAAQIAVETWNDRGWGILDFSFTLPATCQALAFQLESDTSTSDVYWAYLIGLPTNTRELVLPSWVTRPGQIKELVSDVSQRNRWDDPEFWPVAGRVIPDPSNPNNQFKFHFDSPTMGPLYIHAVQQAELLVADAQSTFVDRALLVKAAAYELCQVMETRSHGAARAYWTEQRRRAQREYVDESWVQVPAPTLTPGYSRGW